MTRKLEHTKELLTFKTHKFFEGGKDSRTHKQANVLPPIVGGMKKLSALVAAKKRWDYGGSRDPVIMSKQKLSQLKKARIVFTQLLKCTVGFPHFCRVFLPSPKRLRHNLGEGAYCKLQKLHKGLVPVQPTEIQHFFMGFRIFVSKTYYKKL